MHVWAVLLSQVRRAALASNLHRGHDAISNPASSLPAQVLRMLPLQLRSRLSRPGRAGSGKKQAEHVRMQVLDILQSDSYAV